AASAGQAMTKAAEGAKARFAEGARAAFTATGGTSTRGSAGDDAEPAGSDAAPVDEGTAPAWARRLKSDQAVLHGAHLAAQTLQSGESHGGGHAVDLSEGD
ncbi:MAG: P-type conjugative transfer protein TrbL, partial [Caulobacteraceae bacterium]|nr:P-type conjugative transfer protein TrbL [Caulobacteraceae bacterium]